MPSTAVYLAALPSRMALIAASLMFSGVSKSGSPAPSPITSRPDAFNERALSVTAMVADGLVRERRSARKAIARSTCQRRVLPKAPGAVRQDQMDVARRERLIRPRDKRLVGAPAAPARSSVAVPPQTRPQQRQ